MGNGASGTCVPEPFPDFQTSSAPDFLTQTPHAWFPNFVIPSQVLESWNQELPVEPDGICCNSKALQTCCYIGFPNLANITYLILEHSKTALDVLGTPFPQPSCGKRFACRMPHLRCPAVARRRRGNLWLENEPIIVEILCAAQKRKMGGRMRKEKKEAEDPGEGAIAPSSQEEKEEDGAGHEGGSGGAQCCCWW